MSDHAPGSPPRGMVPLLSFWEEQPKGVRTPEGLRMVGRPAPGVPRAATVQDVERHLVEEAGGTARRRLWADLRTQHGMLLRCEVLAKQWLGGPFVSPADTPTTLLAVTLLTLADLAALDALPAAERAALMAAFGEDEGVSHGIVAELPDDHPRAAAMERVRAYWLLRLGLQEREPVLEIQLRMIDGDQALQ
jgi:hypothetical protein